MKRRNFRQFSVEAKKQIKAAKARKSRAACTARRVLAWSLVYTYGQDKHAQVHLDQFGRVSTLRII